MKSRKKNPVIRLIVLAAVAAALALAYGLLESANRKKAAAELAEAQAAMAASNVEVAAFDPAELTELTWEADGADPLTFVVVNGAWQWKNDAAFPADQTALSAMGSAVTSITALRRVENVEGGRAACGLDDPSCRVTVNYGGERHVYACGDYNGTMKAYYLDADGEIFLTAVNLKTYFTKGLSDLLQRDSIPAADWVSRELVTSVTVRDGGEERTLTEAEDFEDILSALSSVYLRQYADYHADEDEKAAYGLDGSRSVTVNYRKSVSTAGADGNSVTNYLDTAYVFEIGDPDPDDESLAAASPASSEVVYLISAEKAAAILGRES